MSEFELIDKYCRGVGPNHHSTIVDVGDDAAVISAPQKQDLAISTDTMVENIHFLADTEAAHLAHKIFAVNCSDMAAMGAKPKYATLSLTLPRYDERWLAEFSRSLKRQADRYQVQLIGGDTTRGNLSLSFTIIGLLDKSRAILRSGAQLGDDVFVSNTIGDAALGLASLKGEVELPDEHKLSVEDAHHRPQARLELGQGLLGIASSGLDVSDGLVADLGHLCQRSNVSMLIDRALVPISTAFDYYLEQGGSYDKALYGGDDYELAFTCRPDRREEVQALAQSLTLDVTKIGTVIASDENNHQVHLCHKGKDLKANKLVGFNHFE